MKGQVHGHVVIPPTIKFDAGGIPNEAYITPLSIVLSVRRRNLMRVLRNASRSDRASISVTSAAQRSLHKR